MKPLFISICLTTVLGCGSKSDDAGTTDPTPASGFLLSEQNHFSAKIVWQRPPVSLSFDNSADIYFQDPSGQPVTSSRLTRFHLYMVTMGHPSIKESDMVFEQLGPDHWKVSRIFFSMGGSRGSWVVDLDAEANAQPDHIRVSVDHEVD